MKERHMIYFNTGHARFPFTFELGRDYTLSMPRWDRTQKRTRWMDHTVRFIKVTRKGFNLLDLETSKCILRGHLYAKKWSGKDIPKDETKFVMLVPGWIPTPVPVKKAKESS